MCRTERFTWVEVISVTKKNEPERQGYDVFEPCLAPASSIFQYDFN